MATSKRSNLLPTPTGSDYKSRGKNSKQVGVDNYLKSISSREDSHASHSLRPEKDEGRVMTATSGRKCFESFNSRTRDGSSLKTCVGYLLCKTDWYSNKCALTWKPPATKSSRSLFQLSPSTLRIEGTGSGLLLTPSAIQPIERKKAESYLKRQINRNKTGRN